MLNDWIEMTPDNFSIFGEVLGSGSYMPVPSEEEFTWKEIAGNLPLISPSCTGQLNCRYRSRIVNRMERHINTPEIMIALSGHSLLCVAPADLYMPEESDIHCFRVEEGTAFMMNKAVWHWIPFPLQETGSRFLVLFRDGTGADDLHFHELKQTVQI